MKITLYVVRAILIIILTVIILGISVTRILSSTILDEAHVFRTMKSTEYYNKIYEEVKSNFEKYIGPSGLDESLFLDVCTVEDIQRDTETILGNIYEGTEKNIDTTPIKENVIKEFNSALENADVDVDENINQFAEQISEEYLNTIYHTEYENSIYEGYHKIKTIVKRGQQILWILVIGMLITIGLINIKELYNIATDTGIAILSSGLFLVVTYLFVHSNIRVEQIKVLNDSISLVLQSVILSIFKLIQSGGILLAISGTILMILGNIIKVANTTEK